jgi:carboxylesterase
MSDIVIPGAESFFLEGKNGACLMLHGFTASPYEMRYIGHKLNEAGYAVSAPRLPGHGTNIQDLDRTGWEDWYREVRVSYESLAAAYPKVFVVGSSAGGTLALYLLSDGAQVAGAALLSTPVRFHSILLRSCFALLSFVPGLSLLPAQKKRGGPDIRDETTKKNLITYTHGPIRAGLRFIRFVGKTRRRLGRVMAPLLVMQSINDHVIPADNPDIIINSVASRIKRLVWLTESYHILAWDVERDRVAADIIDFFNGL